VWSALVVPLPALGLSLWLDGPDAVGRTLEHPPPAALASTAYTVVGASLLGYVIWNSLLARYPAGAVVPYVLLVPPVGILAAWLALGEMPSALELAGGAVMLAGVAAATINRGPAGSRRSGGRGGDPPIEHARGRALVDAPRGEDERGAQPVHELPAVSTL
jgi:O-acetylserine/cysteine efflux transporter